MLHNWRLTRDVAYRSRLLSGSCHGRRDVFKIHGRIPLARTSHGRSIATTASSQSSVTERNGINHVRLRPYQEESIQAILDHLASGEKRLGLSLATGSGKTVIFSHLIERVPQPSHDASQTLILAHRRELVEQAVSHCRRLYPDKTVEVEMASQRASGMADITVASVQSIMSADRILRFDPSRFKLVLVDEAHHIVSPSYMEVLHHFKLTGKQDRGPAALVGVSATLSRHDGVALGAAIDHIVYHKDYLDMIDDHWLSSVVFTTVRSGVDLSRVKTSKGDFQTGSLSKAVNRHETNTLTVRAWIAKAGARRSTLVFCVDLSHVTGLTAAFREHGIEAHFITGDTPRVARTERLEGFKSGTFPVLINCGIFTEGTDIPNVDCVLLARPTKSRNLLVQMIGRGLRKHADKENCHIIDMVSSLDTGIVTTPTLFGLDPDVLLDAQNPQGMEKIRERKAKEKQREDAVTFGVNPSGGPQELKGNVTFTDYDDINDLIADTSGERHIRAISSNGWVQVDDKKYVLSTRSGEYLTIVKDEVDHHVIYNRKLPASALSAAPFAKPQILAGSSTFEDAVHAADSWASKTNAFPHSFIAKNARWRAAEASQGQVDFLNKLRDEGSKLEVGAITKGRAADWITKVKHGAKGRFGRIMDERRRAERVLEKKQKWKDLQKRSQVSVGPVYAGAHPTAGGLV